MTRNTTTIPAGPATREQEGSSTTPPHNDFHLRGPLISGARTLGIDLNNRAVERFSILLDELLAWNQIHNLTAIREPEEILNRHFLDSLTCVLGYDFSTGRPVLDVGTGAGFPGLPLKIAFPDLKLCLLDSSVKKVDFLNHVCRRLEFQDMDIVHVRAEELGHSGAYRQRFYLVLSRAVAPLPVLAEFCLPFVTVGGYFIAQKALEARPEIAAATGALEVLGGEMIDELEVITPGTDVTRLLVRVRKERGTPSIYPRRPGIPAKRPLTGPVNRKPKAGKYD